MKIGLLTCDRVHPKFLHIAGDYPEMFQAAFPELDFVPYYVCEGEFPSNVHACDAYMSTGSSYSVYEELDWIGRLKGFIQELYQHKIPFVGVCFGHQLIGEALGGKVQKAATGWSIGVKPFEIKEPQSWMRPTQPSLNLLMMCQDQIVTLPPNSHVLATAPNCPIGMFTVGDYMLGIQAHPEFSKAYDRALIDLRVDRIDETTINAAIESFKLPVDKELIRQWIVNWLRDRSARRRASLSEVRPFAP